MEKLTFDTGLQRYRINGGAVLTFNPADPNVYARFMDAVEEIKADAGIDIGFTLIGMHLKKVAVPVRLSNNRIGQAFVLAARTRAKFIGGERANYNTDLY